jgi:hypothetical protein
MQMTSRRDYTCLSGGAESRIEPMATIMLAATSEPREDLTRILAGHDLSCPETLEKAEEMLRTRHFDMIVCTIFFDESRMFDLLRLAKSAPEWKPIPFICARLRQRVLETSITREAVAFTCKALGAAAFLDVGNYPESTDHEMRAVIERFLNKEKDRPTQ